MRSLITSFFLMLTGAALVSCTGGHMLIHQFSDIRDYRKFPSRPLKASSQPFFFAEAQNQNEAAEDVRVTWNERHNDLDSFFAQSHSVALLIIRRDTILYERYAKKFSVQSVVPSFSVAKSFTSALVGIAVAEGKINSVNDSITQYLTELRGKGLEKVKVIHLLQMVSGIDHKENYYNPFAGVSKLYYGHNIRKYVQNHTKPGTGPGLSFDYISLNTQLLGMIVERATGVTLTQYLQEKIWEPAGMEHDATWSVDRNEDGIEKAFCCLNATARDFARFGRLYLHDGKRGAQQVVPAEWVKKSTTPSAVENAAWYYQYQWWLPSRDGDFSAQGHLGQFIYMHPDKEVIIVRLGKKEGDIFWQDVFREIADQL